VSLRWRIAAGLAAIAAVISAATVTAAYLSTSQQLLKGVDESLTARATEVGRPSRQRPGNGPVGFNGGPVPGCPPLSSLQLLSAAQLLSPEGVVDACIGAGPELPVDDADRTIAATDGTMRFRTVRIDGDRYRLLTMPSPRSDGAVMVARDLSEIDRVLDRLRLRGLAFGLAGTAAAAVLGLVLARRLVRPVERLRDTAERIARTQDLATDIPVEGDGEIGSLARSFTTMVGALATSRAQQQRLITDASHELRTPLTSLRTNVELLQRAPDLAADDRREVHDALHMEVEELGNLVAELVELATDRSAEAGEPEPVRLGDLAEQVAARARRRWGREIVVRHTGSGDDTVIGWPVPLERAVGNLVDNAVKYSPDGPVEIDVAGRALEVRDHGPGIAAEDLPHVWERFYRATTARTRPGSGLGLAIVEQVVTRHGGRVSARNHPDGGAVVGFEMPGRDTPQP
jgi:two-component system sensor histidine kinase MprB